MSYPYIGGNQHIQMYGNFEWSGHSSAFVWVGVIFFVTPENGKHRSAFRLAACEIHNCFGVGAVGRQWLAISVSQIFVPFNWVIGSHWSLLYPKAFHKAPNLTSWECIWESTESGWVGSKFFSFFPRVNKNIWEDEFVSKKLGRLGHDFFSFMEVDG